LEQLARKRAFSKSQIGNRQLAIANPDVRLRHGYGATAPKAFVAGGKWIRTPDFQLAKLALYQLSYAPDELSLADCKLRIGDCKFGRRDVGSASPIV
jgi:hypothetical protein